MYIITGTSSGLGYELARQLIGEGKSVIGLSRKLGKAVDLDVRQEFTHISVDLADLDSVRKVAKVVEARISTPSILVLNAAKFILDENDIGSTESAKELFNVNYFSAVELTNALTKKCVERVIFVNSVSGVKPQPNQAYYSSSKHALQCYSEVLAKQSVGKGFDVMSINPGGMKTELWGGDNVGMIDTSDFLCPKMVAKLIINLSIMPKKTYISSLLVLPESDVG